MASAVIVNKYEYLNRDKLILIICLFKTRIYKVRVEIFAESVLESR